MGFAARLLAGTALMAAAQMTTTYPDLGGGTAASGIGPGDATDFANGAEPESRGTRARQTRTEPTNQLGPYGTSLVPGGNGVLGAGDVALGDWGRHHPGGQPHYERLHLWGSQHLRQSFGRPRGRAAAGGFTVTRGQSAMQRVALRPTSHGP
jgi:hypothetical protein